jgi:hypothetical protein
MEAAFGEQGAGGGQDLLLPFSGRASWPPDGWRVGH